MKAGLLYFEDFVPGSVAAYGSYRLTREELIAFAQEFDPQPFHLSDVAAQQTLLGGLAASGWQACAILMRLNCDGFMLGSTSMGAPGIEEVKWLRPLRPGVTLSARRTVLETKISRSKPQMGLVRFRFELIADDSETIMTQVGWIMFARREAA